MRYKPSKLLAYLFATILLLAAVTGCVDQKNEVGTEAVTLKDGTYEGSGSGYGGPLRLSVTVANGKVKDISVAEHNESSPVFTRAFPIIVERIILAQSPKVDNVSAATFTSFAVKTAVNEAMKAAGHDFGKIEFSQSEDNVGSDNKLEDVSTKIVIVGGGPAGLSAAISAKEAGVDDVILIEKLDILSGNGKFDMNFFDLINSQAQKSLGKEISVDDFLKMKEKASDTNERKKAWADENYKLDEWLRGMGIELNYAYGETNHMQAEDAYAGEHIQNQIENRIHELGIDVRTGTKGLDLIIDNNKVTGVSVQTKEGTYNIHADAVIIATGGFASNKELLAKFAPGSESVETSNQIGTTGDFISVFEKNGIQLGNMDKLNVFPFIVRKTRDLTGGADDFILVNKEGNRFVSEKNRGLEFAHQIAEQPGKSAYYIYDQNAFDSAYRLKKHVGLGYHSKAETLDELAETLKIDKTNLQRTVEDYNAAISGEIADPFRGDKVFDRPFASSGPYYGVEVVSAIHMTMGGVVANERAQVLNSSNEPVEGLYAAGEVTDVSGAYNAAIIFGKISGQEASKFVLK